MKKIRGSIENCRKAAGGQMMLLTVLTIGGTILGATTLAGLLVIYQIRQSTDLANSAKAVFAADAGVEWGLYQFYYPSSSRLQPVFTNGALFAIACYGANGNTLDSCRNPSSTSIKSIGSSGNVKRAFKYSFSAVPPPAGPTHLGCDNGACVAVEGGGSDQCSPDTADVDCGPHHTECRNSSCERVPGEGSDKCENEEDCQ